MKKMTIKLKDLILEAYTSKSEILNDYFKGNIDIDELINIAGGLDRVATKAELNKFLNNSFMQDMMADEHNISKGVLVDKVKALLKRM